MGAGRPWEVIGSDPHQPSDGPAGVREPGAAAQGLRCQELVALNPPFFLGQKKAVWEEKIKRHYFESTS